MVKKEVIFLIIIFLVAAFFRLWQLDLIPPGLYPDEAMYANDAIETLKTGDFKVFYPHNFGREGFYMWLLALSFSIFGISFWSLKTVPAVIGILTVLGFYLLTKELFKKNVALLAGFFLAISFWHVNFSRISFRAILVPFILVFGFYFLFKFFNQLKNQPQSASLFYSFAILSGIFFGLGFYTYISYRFIVLLLPLVLIFAFFLFKGNLLKNYLKGISFLMAAMVIVALPIGLYFLWHPQDFVGRAVPVSVFAAENPFKEFGKSLILHLGMFNFHGDPNWRHNFSGSPMLFWLIGILFLIGIALSVKELINFRRSKNLSLVISHLFLVIWLITMLLPGILTYEGIPHALRVIGTIPVVYIFAGLGGWKTYEWLNKIIKNKKLLIFLCLLFLLAVSYAQFCKYFFNWGQRQEVRDAFSKDYVEIGNYLNSLPPEIPKYVIVNVSGVPVPYPDGIPMPAQTVMFIERTKYGKPQATYLLPEDLEKIKIKEKAIILPMKYEESLFNKLLEKFPKGEIQKENNIWFYRVF